MTEFLDAANEAARWFADNPWATFALVWAARGAVDAVPALWRLLVAITRVSLLALAAKLRAMRQRREERQSDGDREDQRIVVRVPWQ